MFFIASLKHTSKHHEHITFWKANWCGYSPVLSEAGQYNRGEASDNLNDGIDCLAVPVAAVEALATATPYYKPGAQFYDVSGPVVDNTRANWNRLVASSLPRGSIAKPTPEVFRGKRRSFALAASTTDTGVAG